MDRSRRISEPLSRCVEIKMKDSSGEDLKEEL